VIVGCRQFGVLLAGMNLKNVSLAVAATLMAFVAGIAIVSYWMVPNPQLAFEGPGLVVFDKELGFVPRPASHSKRTDGPTPNRGPLIYDVYTDERGARVDGPAQQKSAAQVDLVTLGCSFTWGHPVQATDTYSSRLARDFGVATENFSMASYGTLQPLGLLKRNRDLKPKLVIYGFINAHLDRNVLACAASYHPFCFDTAHVAWDGQGKPMIEPPQSNGVRRFQQHLLGTGWNPLAWLDHGIDVIRGRIELARDNERAPGLVNKREEAFAFLFRDMEKTVREMGAELLVVFIPNGFEPMPDLLPRVVGKTRLLDVQPALLRHRDGGGLPIHVIDDGHPNAMGHRLIADEIAAYIKREKLL
jgi:hypothetical protein